MGDFLMWLLMLGMLYVLVSIIRPLPPFKTRLRTLLIGIPALFVWAMIAGMVLMWEDPSRQTPPTIAGAAKKASPEDEKSTVADATAKKSFGKDDAGSIVQPKEPDVEASKDDRVAQTDKPAAPDYDPQSASEATGFTIRQLDKEQYTLVAYAAQFVTAVRYCNYSYFAGDNPILALVGTYGVHPFDFKNLADDMSSATLERIKAQSSWRQFCGTGIYEVFGPDGALFGPDGEYPNIEPWIRPIEIRDGMTKAQVDAEVEFNVAYYGTARCTPIFTEFDPAKEEAYKAKHHLDDAWYEATQDQSIAILNEAFLRLGPESLMDCPSFLAKYKEVLPPGCPKIFAKKLGCGE